MKKENNNLYAVILAGGVGTRFWPMSTKAMPKQFLKIIGKNSLLQETISRVINRISKDKIVIVTNTAYEKEIAKQVSRFGIPKRNILFEPSGKNTAASICWAAVYIEKRAPGAVMAVLASDHLIANKDKFLGFLEEAVNLAKKDKLVIFGITPSRPETGYGYLKVTKVKSAPRDFLKVDKFTEKPDVQTAKKFIKSKNYLWNSGMGVWKSDVVLNEFKQYLPETYNILKRQHPISQWQKLENISVDYGILEKSKNVAAIEARGIGWSDVGSWEALWEVLAKDKDGNVLKGSTSLINCKNSLVWADKRKIALIGLNDIVVIDTPGALLVCNKSSSQKVKEVVNLRF